MASILETVGPRSGSAPLTYTLAEDGTVDVMAIFATFNGAGAGGTFMPVVTVRSQSGAILARGFPEDTVAAGDSANVTFAPFLRTGTSGGTSSGPPTLQLKVFPEWGTLVTGDSKLVLLASSDMNGFTLDAVAAFVSTVSSAGLVTVQVRNVTQAADMLSTRITIDAGEFTSYTAATPPVIDAGAATIATGDLLAIDVDTAGSGAKGLGVVLEFA